MDDIDCANDRGQLYLETALALHATLAHQRRGPSTGICRTCGDQIEHQRLRANAHARHCYDCAAEQEEEVRRLRRRGAF